MILLKDPPKSYDSVAHSSQYLQIATESEGEPKDKKVTYMSEIDQLKRKEIWEDFLMKGSVKYVRGAKLRTETTTQDSKISQAVGRSSSTKEVNGK